jgi:hypothetical protein
METVGTEVHGGYDFGYFLRHCLSSLVGEKVGFLIELHGFSAKSKYRRRTRVSSYTSCGHVFGFYGNAILFGSKARKQALS